MRDRSGAAPRPFPFPTAMLRMAKRGIFSLARRLQLFSIARRSAWRRDRLLILCYHSVSMADEHEWNGELYMSQELLRARFAMLRDSGYSVLPLDEGVRRLYEGTLPPASVALTFDDGMYNFAARAVPVLEEFGYPATVYVATYYCEHQLPVFPIACGYVSWAGRAAGSCSASGLAEGDEPLRVSTEAERRASVKRIDAWVTERELSAAEKDRVAEEFASRLGVDYGRLRRERMFNLMSPDEVRALGGSRVDVQLHTHRHRAPDDAALFVREIEDNRRSLAAMSGPAWRPHHFCYPSGKHRPAMLPLLRGAGIETATTCAPGLATRATDPLLLPRFVDTSFQAPLAFEAWASGFALLLPRRTA